MALHADKKELVSAKDILRSGEDIEAAAEYLYRTLSEKFEYEHEASNFFYELAQEERQHKEFLRFSLSMINKLPDTFVPNIGIVDVLDKALLALREFQREVDSKDITLERAFTIVYEVENMVFESEYMELATLHLSSLKNRFKQVIDDTKRHRGAVLTLANKLGFDMPSGMANQMRHGVA